MKIVLENILFCAIVIWIFIFRLFYYNYTGLIVYFLLYTGFFLLYGMCLWKGKFLLLFATILILTFIVELIGVNTGIVFGHYNYVDYTPHEILGISILIPLSWFIFTFVIYNVTTSYIKNNRLIILFSSLLLVCLDLIVDPVLVSIGFWEWEGHKISNELSLSSWFGIPWSNYLGWFLVGLMVFSLMIILIKPVMKSEKFLFLFATEVISYILMGIKIGLILPVLLGGSIIFILLVLLWIYLKGI